MTERDSEKNIRGRCASVGMTEWKSAGPFGFGRGGLLDSSFFGDSCFVLLN